MKHGVPAILSFFVPGLGQMVKGQMGRGIMFFLFTILGYVLLMVPGLILHIWCIIDAYNE